MSSDWVKTQPLFGGYTFIHRVADVTIITRKSRTDQRRSWEVTMTVRATVGFPVSWPSINAAVHRRHLLSLCSDWNMWESVQIVCFPVKVAHSGVLFICFKSETVVNCCIYYVWEDICFIDLFSMPKHAHSLKIILRDVRNETIRVSRLHCDNVTQISLNYTRTT